MGVYSEYVKAMTTKAVKGVGPDAPTVTNENGGKQSATPYRFDLLPSSALFDAAETLAHGADKYGARNWENISIPDHLNHAAQHLFAFIAGDTTENHLAHAIVRLMFALDLHNRSK